MPPEQRNEISNFVGKKGSRRMVVRLVNTNSRNQKEASYCLSQSNAGNEESIAYGPWFRSSIGGPKRPTIDLIELVGCFPVRIRNRMLLKWSVAESETWGDRRERKRGNLLIGKKRVVNKLKQGTSTPYLC